VVSGHRFLVLRVVSAQYALLRVAKEFMCAICEKCEKPMQVACHPKVAANVG